MALPSGRITMLFSDIEGSTRLLRSLGDLYGEVLSDQRSIIRAALTTHGGHEMGTEGDSFFVVFPSALLAVSAAVEAQRGLAAHVWPLSVALRVRMGLETGEPLRHEDSYMGIDVHRAARIAGSSNGGQVVLGDSAKREVAGLLPPDVTLRDLGLHRLKDLPGPEHLYQLVVEGLVDVTTAVTSLGAPSNLPRLHAPLVGRASEIEATRSLLASQVRLVTITGPGGVGKTSLALAVARDVEHEYPAGVYFVELEDARTTAAAWDALARALGVTPDDTSEQAVVAFLAGRAVLLVLDNLEQLDGAASVARSLIERTACTIVATSRGPLRLRAEHERVLAPLDAPHPGMPFGAVATMPSVELFVREAQRARASFALTPANAGHVAAICARLEGLPLGIELAAAQMRLLSPQALATSVEQQLGPSSRDVDRPGRQRTLEAAIGWSVDLLPPDDRDSFHRLGVFAGGADLAAVAAVLAGEGTVERALATVEALADVSLLTVGEGPMGQPRIAMLGTVRGVALSGLERRGALHEARLRYCEHYVRLAEEAEPRLRGPESLLWSDRLAADEENLREAFEWALASGTSAGRSLAIRLATALGWHAYTHGRAREWRSRIEAAIGDGTDLDPRSRADALHALGVLEQQQGDNVLAMAAFEASLGIWQLLEDSRGIARELNSLGVALWAGGDAARSRQVLEESITVARAVGDEQRIAAARSNLGILDLGTGRTDAAIEAFEEALAFDTRHGDSWAVAVDRCNLGGALACAARVEDSRRVLADALRAVVELGDSDLLVSTLESCALLAEASSDHEKAIVLYSGSEAARRAVEVPRTAFEQALLERELEPARAALGSDRYASAWERGQCLGVDALLVLAATPG